MKVKTDELGILYFVLTILSISIYFSPHSALRPVIGFIFLLLPGFPLVSGMFPRKSSIDGVRRLGLSVGISLVIATFIAFILNYTPFGITVDSIFISNSCWAISASIYSWLRRRRISEQERFNLTFKIPAYFKTNAAEKWLLYALTISIVLTLTTFGYVIAFPKTEEKFSEFYLIGPDGNAGKYPQEIKIGEPVQLVAVIVNHQELNLDCRIEVKLNDVVTQTDSFSINRGENLNRAISFLPPSVGDNQKVELFLYSENIQTPVQTLFFWINVK